MAQAIRHEQQGEIALMSCAAGGQAALLAVPNMFADNVNNADGDLSWTASCQP
jgi:hypothetical protein